MDTSSPYIATVPSAAQVAIGDETAFLILGRELVPGVIRVVRADLPYTAILLTSRIDPAELTEALDKARDPAVPIADSATIVGCAATSSEIAWIQPAWRRPGDTSLRSSAAWPSFRSEPRRQNVPN